jgi:hypothetical protein
MADDMCLRNFRPRTHEAYSRAVQQFIDHIGGEPEGWSEEEVRRYFLYLHHDIASSSGFATARAPRTKRRLAVHSPVSPAPTIATSTSSRPTSAGAGSRLDAASQ